MEPDSDCTRRCNGKHIERLSAGCMVCGDENPNSMGVQFSHDGADAVSAETVIPEQYQGFRGIAHGGSVAAVLDDAMWWAIYRTRGVCTMTAQMNVRYRRPVGVGDRVALHGRLVSRRRRLFEAKATLTAAGDDENTPLATAEGRYIISSPDDIAT